jgi:hypothetical protein
MKKKVDCCLEQLNGDAEVCGAQVRSMTERKKIKTDAAAASKWRERKMEREKQRQRQRKK